MFFPGACLNFRKDEDSLPGLRKEKTVACGERISLSASHRGSLTVEAACVMPIFVYVVLAFMYFFEAVSTAGCVAEGLHDAGKQMAVYACALEAAGDEAAQAAGIVSLAYASGRISQATDEDAPTVSLLRSSVLDDDEMIDLVAEYRFSWRMPFISLTDMSVIQRARVRAWTGRSGECDGDDDKSNIMVYVTVNGSVYHNSRECTHIRLSVQSVSAAQVSGLRNSDGGKYYSCEVCGGSGSRLYITGTGDRYHSSVNCSGLKRGVLEVPLSQVEDWPPCSRCGG